MKQLIKYFGDSIVGVSSGFDRIVFQGMIRPVMYPEGAMGFFDRRRILFKDARNWVTEQTEKLVSTVEEWSKRECGERITNLPSSKTRKEKLAHQRQKEKGITVGPIGVWSCLEACGSYRLVPAKGCPKLRYVQTRCKHLYVYLDHADYGFMSIRIQTWFPFRIQIAMNGREWLARQLGNAGIGFGRHGNKILQVDDFSAMQPLLDQQLTTNWCSLLNSFVPIAFPTFTNKLGTDLCSLAPLRGLRLSAYGSEVSAGTCGRANGPAISCSRTGRISMTLCPLQSAMLSSAAIRNAYFIGSGTRSKRTVSLEATLAAR